MMAIELTPDLIAWANSVADEVARHVPPQFDRYELRQAAVMACWRASKQFDSTRFPGVPFMGFAYQRVRGAAIDQTRWSRWKITQEIPIDGTTLKERLADDVGRFQHVSDRKGCGQYLPGDKALEDRLDVGMAADRVWRLLAMLRPEWQELARLVWHEGYSVREAAEAMGIPVTRGYFWRRQIVLALKAEMLDRSDEVGE